MPHSCSRFNYGIIIGLVLFFIFQYVFVFRDFSLLDSQKYDLEDQLAEKQHELDRLKSELGIKERDVKVMERRLADAERMLRRKKDRASSLISSKILPEIFVITPTLYQATQRADLTRLAQTLMHVANLHWIIVEDEDTESDRMRDLISSWPDLRITHLAVRTPVEMRMNYSTDPRWLKPRGVLQRNLGLSWIRSNLSKKLREPTPVLYFADDDNTYDLRIFEELRSTTLVSVWPVAFSGGLLVERPVVTNGKVTDFLVGWFPERSFPLDMAGFAVNVKLIMERPSAEFSYAVMRGMQESHLLGQLVTRDQLEPKANNCSKVLVWHTRTVRPELRIERKWQASHNFNSVMDGKILV